MKKIFATLGLAALTACSAVTPPKSLDESLAYLESQATAFETSAAQGLTAGTLTVADATFALSIGDQVMSTVAAGRAAEKVGDATTAQGKLALATSLLSQLAAYLQAHGK